MASWQSFAESVLDCGDAVGAVIGSTEPVYGYSVLGMAGDVRKPTPQEMEALVKRFETPNNGQYLVLAGQKFIQTTCTRDYLMGWDNAWGIAIARSNKIIIIGRSGAGQDTGRLRDAVLRMADGLRLSNS